MRFVKPCTSPEQHCIGMSRPKDRYAVFLISESLHGLKEMSRSIGRAFTNQSVVYGYTRSTKKGTHKCRAPRIRLCPSPYLLVRKSRTVDLYSVCDGCYTESGSSAIGGFCLAHYFRIPPNQTLGFKKHQSRNSKGFVARIDGEGSR